MVSTEQRDSVAADAEALSRGSSSVSSVFRSSWHPEWMDSMAWLDKVAVPMDEYNYVVEESDEDDETSDDESEPDEDRWVVLFTHLAKAITQSTPWCSRDMDKKARRNITQQVVKKFLDRSTNAFAMGKKVKQALRRIRDDGSHQAVQLCYIAFMSDVAWNGYDAFRAPDNFYVPEHHRNFVTRCSEKVQHRLHMINEDISRTEAKVTSAINGWNEIHSSSVCFGHMVVVTIDEIEAVWSGSEKEKHAPDNVVASVMLYIGAKNYHHVFVRGVARRTKGNKSLARWSGPRPVTLAIGESGENVEESYVFVELTSRGVCGFGAKEVATVRVPLIDLYSSIAPFDAKARQEEKPGMHFVKGRYLSADGSIAMTCRLQLFCGNEEHHLTPPLVDVVCEQERRRHVSDNVNEEEWMVDHHAAVRDLVDVFGELDDGTHYALQLYCDRYLVHEEHSTSAMLVSVATKGDFANAETREAMVEAVEGLLQLRPRVVAKSTGEWIDSTISEVRSQCIGRIVTLEDVSNDPEDATDMFIKSRRLLELCGVSASEIPAYVEERTKETSDYICKRVVKLTSLIAAAVEHPGSPGAGRGRRSRTSVLLELEQRDDKDQLAGKAKVLLELVDMALFQTQNSLDFATKSKCAAVIAIAVRRSDVLLTALRDPMSKALNAIFVELTRQLDPDPLGDTFGILTTIYSRVVDVVVLLEEHDPLEHLCFSLTQMFHGFLPCWFSLCETKILIPPTKQSLSWVDGILRANKLEPIVPNRLHANHAPADARGLLESLSQVFLRVLEWSDPNLAILHCTSFAKVCAQFAEVFQRHQAAVGRVSKNLDEWIVCVSTMHRFLQMFCDVWEELVTESLVDQYGDEESLLKCQCGVIKQQAMAELVEQIDKFIVFVARGIQKWARDVFDEFCGGANSPTEVFIALSKELRHIIASTWPAVARALLREAAKALHLSFDAHVLAHAEAQLATPRAAEYHAVLESVDRTLEDVAGDMIDPEDLFILTRRSRALVQLASLPTATLIRDATAQDSRVTEGERSRIMRVLEQRVDKEAEKCLKKLKNK